MDGQAPPDILTPEQRDQISSFLESPLKYPSEFKQWLTDYLATNIPPIPVSQLLGYKGTLARYEFVAGLADVTTPERTWTDLGGPEITGLADGVYWAAWGVFNPGLHVGSSTNRMGLAINGVDPTSYCQSITVDTAKSVWRANRLTVKNGKDNNSVSARYYWDLSGGASGQFQRRWMALLRIT